MLIVLGIGWVLWCCLHSLLIGKSVQNYTVRLFARIGFTGFRYRLFYTVAAIASLLPLLAATFLLRGEVVFAWRGGWHLLELTLAVTALWLFQSGSKQYDLHEMVYGKEQAEGDNGVTSFSRAGVHGMVRHPWYLGSLLFLWAWPVYHQGTVLAAIILSCYLIIGTLIEERRLVAEYGDAYRQYQQEVSMLIPWRWVRQRLKRRC